MFVADSKYCLFADELKNSFAFLVKGLSEIWSNYDRSIDDGDFYSTTSISKEEADRLKNNLEINVQKLLEDTCNNFKLDNYKPFVKELFSWFGGKYEKIRWFYNVLDYDSNGRIVKPIDMYSIVGDPHQGKMNFVIDSIDLKEETSIREYILNKYKKDLEQQAEIIIGDYKDDLELLWDDIIFINMKNENSPSFIEISSIIERHF